MGEARAGEFRQFAQSEARHAVGRNGGTRRQRHYGDRLGAPDEGFRARRAVRQCSTEQDGNGRRADKRDADGFQPDTYPAARRWPRRCEHSPALARPFLYATRAVRPLHRHGTAAARQSAGSDQRVHPPVDSGNRFAHRGPRRRLTDLARAPTMFTDRVLSGMRPTGRMHIGHYHGALKNWVKLQQEYECLYFAADWHALTTHFEAAEVISETVWEMFVDWLAAGINPSRATIFIQSRVPEHAELALLLGMITPVGWLERVPTYKDQQQKLTR